MARNPTNDEARRTNILLEKLQADFQLFGEKLDAVSSKLDGTFEEVGRQSVRLGRVEDRLLAVETRLTSVENRLTSVETRLSSVEGAVDELKDEFKKSDAWLHAVETKLPS